MNPTDLSDVAAVADTNVVTVMSRVWSHFSSHGSSVGTRLILIILLAVLVHVTVRVIRNVTEWIISRSHAHQSPLDFVTHAPKFVTLIQLIASAVTFVMYFFALGLVLQELGVNLTGYLASASILALAISFGSQGLVQDVVISLTLIFSDAMDAGDMVEIVGTVSVTGRVEEIGLRFTTLRNFYNQTVFIPNRTIGNVSRFVHGGVYAFADIQVPAGADAAKVTATVEAAVKGMWSQFGAIILEEPVLGAVETAEGGGWQFLRVHFKIWPGQGGLIENTFRQQVISALRKYDPQYADWQVPVTYRAKTVSRTV